MSYQVFARKYRPKTFNDVLGQDHVVQTLKNAITQNRLAHAFLFVGPRGTGKTSTARILAKALNCPNGPSVEFDPEHELCKEIANGVSLDVLEIDGASNNGVEQVRDLRENVRFAPTRGKFKIYYIDEVHMLSTQAFNALLKTLEEPPEHVKFIFATTEPNKILPTIISRCQRFDLRPITTETIAQHLRYIASEENVKLTEEAAWAIAKGADGGMRDAQSMLDQLVAFCGSSIQEQEVLNVFGFTSREIIARLTVAILSKDVTTALEVLHEQTKNGKDLGQLLDGLISCIRALLVSKVNSAAKNEGFTSDHWQNLTSCAKKISSERLLNTIEIFAQSENRMKWASNKRLHLEIGIIKAIQALSEVRISDVISALESANSGSSPTLTVEEKWDEANPLNPNKAEHPSTESENSPLISEKPSTSNTHQSANPKKNKPTSNTTGSIDFEALIEAAPERTSPAAPETETNPISHTNEKENNEELSISAPEASTEENDQKFYQDPLITEALTMFRARLIE